MDRPPLAELQAFAWVAEHRSFRRAAAAHGASPSGLSQLIRNLEERLGLRLLNRTTRSVGLTDAGRRLLERVAPALETIAGAVAEVSESDGDVAGVLRINAPEPAVELVLAPLIGRFLAAHPRVRLELMSESAFVDIVGQGYDAGVRWEESLDQDMIAVPLGGRQRYCVVAAPELIARDGVPSDPADMLHRPAIRLRFASGVTPPWEFERDGRVVRVSPPPRLVTNSIPLQLRAALDGIGYWSTLEDYVREPIADGRLVPVLQDWTPSFPGPMLYYPSRRQAPAALRAFVAFIRDERAGRGEGAGASAGKKRIDR